MSGEPHPKGVTEVIKLLDSIADADAEMLVINHRMVADKRSLAELQEFRRNAWNEYVQLMQSMDVSSPGNFGFEGRVAWFLTEMRRQLQMAKDH